MNVRALRALDFTTLIVAQKPTTTAAQMIKALCFPRGFKNGERFQNKDRRY